MGPARSFARRFRHRLWRGSATLFGAIFLSVLAMLLLAAFHEERQDLVDAEADRELGRIWGMTCEGAHRAVQAGMVTTARQVTAAELRSPPAPFRPFLPAGLRTADAAGALVARYGTVMADGVPLAACSLSGPEIGDRWPSLREGAVMAGLDEIGFVGGDATPMHARLAAVQAVLGALPAGAMFATADFGLGHASERVHRRAIGGRPELATVQQDVLFQGGVGILGAGRVASERTEASEGTMPATARAEAGGDVIVGPLGSLAVEAATVMEAEGGFAFGGGTQTVFSIPAALSVGTSMRSRGAVQAQNLQASGDLDAGGGLTATAGTRAASLVLSGEGSAVTGNFSGDLDVRPGGCTGCIQPTLGSNP